MGKMKQIDVTHTVNAPVDTVWRLVGDRSTWPDWSPLGSYEPVKDGATDTFGVGSVNRYHTGRITATEEVVEYVPNSRLSYTLLSGMPLEDYRADIDLTPVEVGTDVHFHSSFRPRFVGTGWVYQRALRIFVRRMLNGLAEHVAAERVTSTRDSVTTPIPAPNTH